MGSGSSAVDPNVPPVRPVPPFGALHHEKFKNAQCIANVRVFREQRERRIQTYKERIRIFKGQGNNAELCEQILQLTMMELKTALQDRKYTAVTVAHAYIERAIQIDERLNCITEMIGDIITAAEEADRKAKDCNNLAEEYPLYGLPFSIKSNFHVAGYAATVGLSQLLGTNQAADCGLVQFLKEKGAIPICLTNVPQGLLAYVTSNPVYGTTKNPWDLSRTPGGSSGGEAALVAAGGVAFGIGNDLVGSLRIPAAFCGLVSLKPSEYRIREEGMHKGPRWTTCLGLNSGFFTRTVEEQSFLYNLVMGSHIYPPPENQQEQQPQPQREGVDNDAFSSPSPSQARQAEQNITGNIFVPPILKIAYFTDDRFHTVAPSNKLAVRNAIRDLNQKYPNKFKFVEFQWQKFHIPFGGFPVNSSDAAERLFRNVMPDNGECMYEMYINEPWDANMKFFISLLRLRWRTFVHYLSHILSVPLRIFSKGASTLARSHNTRWSTSESNERRTNELRDQWRKYWNDNEFHAMICPAFITPAQPFGSPAKLATGTFSTGLFNMLDVPAGVVPVAPVDSENDAFCCCCNCLHCYQKSALSGTEDLPNAVQVVTQPGREQDCLDLMQMIEAASENVQKLV